jgi:tetratricopeptide (TPR) repeat protein
MGTVHEVLDREREIRCALKVLKQEGALDELRFRREFRAIAGYHHPNLVRLFDLVQLDDGRLGFTMELLEGSNLFSVLCGEGSLPPSAAEEAPLASPAEGKATAFLRGDATRLDHDEGPDPDHPPAPVVPEAAEPRTAPRCDLVALSVVLGQVLDALDFLHQRGIVHRDLKPENIMVDPRGRVRLLDFGIIERIRDDDPEAGSIRGTPGYMAPELFLAERATPASDLYALGCVLFRLLSGRLPFPSSNPAELGVAHTLRAPPPIARLVSDLPDDLAWVCDALLQKSPAARPTIAVLRERLGLRPQDAGLSAASLDDPGLVERAAEREVLREELARALAGAPRVVLLSGASGMGKSTLASAFREDARAAGCVILEGRCYEREALPFRALGSCMDELSLLLSRWPRAERASLADDARTVSTMFGGFSLIAGDGPPSRAPPRGEVFSALRRILAGVARQRPLLLLIDDLQWTDAESIELITALLSAPPLGRLLLLGLARPVDDPAHPLAALSSRREVRSISLSPLAPGSVRRMIEGLLGPREEGAYEALIARSQGNPFFVRQLSLALRDRPDLASAGRLPGLDELVEARRGGLSEGARALLDLCSAVGAPASLRTLDDASGPGGIQAPLDELLLAGLLSVAFSPKAKEGRRIAYDVSHDAFRERVYAAIAPTRRRELHRRLLSSLERDPDASKESLLRHAQAVGDRVRIHRYARAAAREAQARLSYERAAALYDVALSSVPGDAPVDERADLHLEASLARHGMNDYPSVKRHLGSALALLRVEVPAGPPALAADTARLVALRLLRGPGDRPPKASGPEGKARLRAVSALLHLIEIHITDNQPVPAVHATFLALALAETCPPSPELAVARSMVAACFAMIHWLDQGQRYLDAALALAHRLEDRVARASVLVIGSEVLLARSRFPEAIAMREQAHTLYAEEGAHERAIHALAMVQVARQLQGQADEIEGISERLAALARRYGDPIRLSTSSMSLAMVALRRGDLSSAEAHLAHADGLLKDRSHGIIESQRLSLHALLSARRGEPEAAITRVEAFLASLREPAGPPVVTLFVSAAAEALHRAGAQAPGGPQVVRAMDRFLRRLAVTQPFVRPLLQLHRARHEPDRKRALSLAREAVRACEARGLRYELGRALELQASLEGDPILARALARRAAVELKVCGAG